MRGFRTWSGAAVRRTAGRSLPAARTALLPGLTLGLFLPLLLTNDPRPWLTLLAFTLPAGLAAALLLAAWLGRAAGDRSDPGGPAGIRWALTPLALLNLSHLVFLIHVPAIPFFVGAAATGATVYRGFSLLARRRDGNGRGLETAAFLLVFLPLLFFLFQVNIVHDAYQYLGILVSMAFDHDLNFFNEIFLMNADRFFNPFASHSARYLGVPLLEAPFLAVGHLAATVLSRAGVVHAATGMTYPYVVAVGLASTLFGLGALVLMYLLCREFFPREVSLTATLGFWLASPLPFFSMAWNGWAHPFNVFFIALFLLCWQRTRGERSTLRWLSLGALGGLLILLRPTNAVVAIFPLWELVGLVRKRGREALPDMARAGMGALAAAVVFSPQLAMWRAVSGRFLQGPYREIGDYFDWLNPQIGGVLFDTARHGLLAWSPLSLPAFLGLLLLLRRDRAFAALSLAVCLITLYVYSCWSVWWTGIGFSNRFFTELCPFLVLGLAALLQGTRRRLKVSGTTAAGVLSLFALWNIFLIGEYRAGLVPYGIPDPGRFISDPLTLPGIVRNHLFVFPGEISSFLTSQWGNDSLFPNQILHHLSQGRWAWATAVLLVFVAVSGVLALVTRLLLRPSAGDFLRKRAASFLGMAGALVLLLNGAILAAQRGTVPMGDFHRVDAINLPVRRLSADTHIYVNHPRPVIQVDLLSYLVYGHAVGQGQPVAVASIFDENDRQFDFLLRAGVQTAENSYLRPEFIDEIRHELPEEVVIREGMTTAYSRHRYPALTFHTRLELPEPVVVRRIRVRYRNPAGEMVVSDVFLRDF